jgi:TPR repeat protein
MARLGHMFASNTPAAAAHAAAAGAEPLDSAMHWFRRASGASGAAATSGPNVPSTASALLGLASMHLWGNGTDVDHAKAYELLTRVAAADGAVEAEAAEAKYLLGVMWLKGWGTPEKSLHQAQRLFAEAATVRAGLVMRCA